MVMLLFLLIVKISFKAFQSNLIIDVLSRVYVQMACPVNVGHESLYTKLFICFMLDYVVHILLKYER